MGNSICMKAWHHYHLPTQLKNLDKKIEQMQTKLLHHKRDIQTLEAERRKLDETVKEEIIKLPAPASSAARQQLKNHYETEVLRISMRLRKAQLKFKRQLQFYEVNVRGRDSIEFATAAKVENKTIKSAMKSAKVLGVFSALGEEQEKELMKISEDIKKHEDMLQTTMEITENDSDSMTELEKDEAGKMFDELESSVTTSMIDNLPVAVSTRNPSSYQRLVDEHSQQSRDLEQSIMLPDEELYRD